MRTIDISELLSLGDQGNGPWRVDEYRLLRTSRFNVPLQTPDQAQELFNTYRLASQSNVPTARPLELVRVQHGYGVLIEWIRGLGLWKHMVLGSYGIEEAAGEVGSLLHRLHKTHVSSGYDWKGRFLWCAQALAEHLPKELGDPLVELVAAIPESDSLLHGDLHLGNIVVCGDTLALIDLEGAGRGNPVFDLAISRWLLKANARFAANQLHIEEEQMQEVETRCWGALLREYVGDVSPRQLNEVDRRITVLAIVQGCCLAHRPPHDPRRDLATRPRQSFEQGIHMLAELLPSLTRLDLG